MRYHDYKLRGYSVTDSGATIVFFLAYDYPGVPLQESRIKFEGVTLHRFAHMQASIITGIDEVPVVQLFSDQKAELADFDKMLGLPAHKTSTDTVEEVGRRLQEQGFKAWDISSAIGFAGYIVGRQALQLE